MPATTNTKIIISAEDRTKAAFASVHKNLSGLARFLPFALSGAGFIEFSRAALEAAKKSEEAGSRLNAVLKATGMAAGVTRREIDDLADSMAGSTQFDDESIRNAAAELLKFRNIQGDTFRETLTLSSDVAAFFGQDLPSAAAALGKSMEEPEAAFGLLRRAGITLTEQQKDLIRSMELAGDKAGAQSVILEKLRGTFGGTAAAMNTGINKATNDLKKSWDELLESIGKTDAVSNSARASMGAFTMVFTELKKLIDEADQRARDSILFKLGKIAPKRLTPEQGGLDLGGKNLLEGITPDNFEEKARAASAAQEQKDKAAEDAAYERRQKTQGILADLRRATMQNEESITRDEKEKARIRVEISKQEMEKKIKELEKQGVSRKAIEADYNKWLASEQAKAANESRTQMHRLNDDWQDVTKQMHQATANWAHGATDALTDFVMTGKASFSDFANSVIRDLVRIYIQRTITGPIFTAMEGAGIFSSIGSLLGFARGGDFTVGGSGGTDSQIVAFRATPDEKVSVRTPAQQQHEGGNTYYIDNRGADAAAVARLERTIVALNGSIEHRAVNAVVDAQRRGMVPA